jgi:hypothetical protein
MLITFTVFLIFSPSAEPPDPFLLDNEKFNEELEEIGSPGPFDTFSNSGATNFPPSRPVQQGISKGLIVLIAVLGIALLAGAGLAIYCLWDKKGRDRVKSDESWHDPLKYAIDPDLIDA